MAKIIFLINRISEAGGSERVATVLANNLVKIGHEVSFVSWIGPKECFFDLDKSIVIHNLYDHQINIFKSYLPSLIKYRKIINSIKPDKVIDVCTAMSLLSIPATLFSKSKVITWEHFNTSVNWNFLTARLSRFLAAQFSYKVVTLTDTDKKNYENKFFAKNGITISNPITVTIGEDEKADLRARRVLAIGRLTDQKGFDLLLRAWRIVCDYEKEWVLTIVGDGELKDELIALAGSLKLEKNLIFEKPTNNISQYYKISSIYVMSSRFEGLPLVLIEAKSFGLPIISFDCKTGPREIVRHNIDGVLVPPEDIDLLAKALLDLMLDIEKRKIYSDKSSEDVSRFSVSSFVNKWQGIINL
ncbi:glycosyltransferase family 4 protein [Flavobacterium aquiphilum]|uniref:glycosyltransferase family 4 protein n=1 Tax=Flavobacterium aquiphilum TaxID=3003261 RepID=UPI002481671A|nr:glycosyltransferase family 4 protein [Flavobacterium aquiphilum]